MRLSSQEEQISTEYSNLLTAHVRKKKSKILLKVFYTKELVWGFLKENGINNN